MEWSSLLTVAVIGLMFYLMMRHGGGCCGHSSAGKDRPLPPK